MYDSEKREAIEKFWGEGSLNEGVRPIFDGVHGKIETFEIRDFRHLCNEFARGFNFGEYWDDYVVPLDERFKNWDSLKRILPETGYGYEVRILPELRKGVQGDKYLVSYPTAVKAVRLASTEWVVEEVWFGDQLSDSNGMMYDVVQFHRILAKLFENRELTAEEAIEELKKWRSL